MTSPQLCVDKSQGLGCVDGEKWAKTTWLEDDAALRRAEIIMALSLATDLGTERPLNNSEWERVAGLTRREIDVLRVLVRGLTNRQMAGALGILEKTVDTHIMHIYQKIGCSTRSAASIGPTSRRFSGGIPAFNLREVARILGPRSSFETSRRRARISAHEIAVA